jgi:hypothetical protein
VSTDPWNIGTATVIIAPEAAMAWSILTDSYGVLSYQVPVGFPASNHSRVLRAVVVGMSFLFR